MSIHMFIMEMFFDADSFAAFQGKCRGGLYLNCIETDVLLENCTLSTSSGREKKYPSSFTRYALLNNFIYHKIQGPLFLKYSTYAGLFS